MITTIIKDGYGYGAGYGAGYGDGYGYGYGYGAGYDYGDGYGAGGDSDAIPDDIDLRRSVLVSQIAQLLERIYYE